MRAMVLGEGAELVAVEREVPQPEAGEVLVQVRACGVCRTDLHVVDRELPDVPPGIVPGHEIVGAVAGLGAAVESFAIGERVGIPWLGGTCGACPYCANGSENLCDAPSFTGYTRDGGYADYVLADARYVFRLPEAYDDVQAAPLLCAGLIGYRSLKMAGPGKDLGIFGFGAAAHIVAQIANAEGRRVHAFTRPGDEAAQEFALSLGVASASGSDVPPTEPLDAALIFAPVGSLVPVALRAVRKGGTVVCGGIHMSDIPTFPYADLWGERTLRSVANLTRQDAVEFLDLASRVPIHTRTVGYPLDDANTALGSLRDGSLSGAAVLLP